MLYCLSLSLSAKKNQTNVDEDGSHNKASM